MPLRVMWFTKGNQLGRHAQADEFEKNNLQFLAGMYHSFRQDDGIPRKWEYVVYWWSKKGRKSTLAAFGMD